MAASIPTPLPNIISASTIRSFPESISKTGTWTSTGNNVIGTGTKFLTELLLNNNPGLLFKYLFNTATGEIREIYSVNSDTHLVLKNGFAINVSGQALFVVNHYALHSISIMPLGAGVIMYTPESAGTTLSNGVPVNIENDYGILPIGLNCVSSVQVVTN
jgi:hypothetical protein